jgi:hypothetical protein
MTIYKFEAVFAIDDMLDNVRKLEEAVKCEDYRLALKLLFKMQKMMCKSLQYVAVLAQQPKARRSRTS